MTSLDAAHEYLKAVIADIAARDESMLALERAVADLRGSTDSQGTELADIRARIERLEAKRTTEPGPPLP